MARLEQLLEQIRKDRDVRQNIIEIRQNISDESLRRQFLRSLNGDYSLMTRMLEHEDPKVRKNAALILGMTMDASVLPALFNAWEREEILFIREDYLKAASGMDYSEYLPLLKKREAELSAGSHNGEDMAGYHNGEDMSDGVSLNPLWDNDKHLLAELSRLRRMIDRYGIHARHTFTKLNPAPDLILITNLLHPDVTAKQVLQGNVKQMRGSVYVKGGDLNEIMKIRTWMECLFPVPGARPITGDEKMIASKLRDLKIGSYLNYLHEDNGQPFRYRIELKSRSVPREKKGEYIRRIASRLDSLEKGKLLNSDSDYEAELRLIERKDGSLVPMLKLYTIPDERFSYRRKTTAQSTSATLSALSAALAGPYLKEGAQVLDPFCGSGTLLIERCKACGADPVYGVDRYSEAVEKAKINSEGLYPPIHYINRDFFDFTHDYPFDEIITYLPDAPECGADEFAVRFLRKAAQVLKDGAVMIVLTDAPDSFRAAAETFAEYTIKEKYLLNERTGCSEYIVTFAKGGRQ